MTVDDRRGGPISWTTLEYRPPAVISSLGIGMVGCGGIARLAAQAYRDAGFSVTAICDLDRAAAERLRDELLPAAAVFTDHRDLLSHPAVDVVDIATRVDVRAPIIRDALLADKHVQSQKPFVDDLAIGEELCDLADRVGRRLAVNQNARWAPHFSYLLAAIRANALGHLVSADFDVYRDHDSVLSGTPAAEMEDLVLYDLGIHWFDLINVLFANRTANSVYTLATRSRSQHVTAETMTSTVIDFGDAQACLTFRASTRTADESRFRVDGETATLRSTGPSLDSDRLVVSTPAEEVVLQLDGSWLPDALSATMGELLTAIADDREPTNSGRSVLGGNRFCLAAIESARTRMEVDPARVQRLGERETAL